MLTYFFIVMLVATLILFSITRLAAARLISTHYGQKSDFFEHHPVQPGDIVFLGDSITEGARWHELFPDLPVKNRGINADTVSGVLERLDDITSGHPAAIFILIGTNDLPWYVYHSDEDILETYEKILKRMRAETPDTRVFVQSILPRHPRYSRRIQKLNSRLREMAALYNYQFINLYPEFADSRGGIHANLTNDQLHLMAGGYARWVKILTPYLNELKQQKEQQPERS